MEQVGIDYYERDLIKNMCQLRIAFYMPKFYIKNNDGEKIVYKWTNEEAKELYKEMETLLKDKIIIQKDVWKWAFIFLAANQDAFAAGFSFGIDPKDTFDFQATGQGVRGAYTNMSASLTSYRTNGSK